MPTASESGQGIASPFRSASVAASAPKANGCRAPFLLSFYANFFFELVSTKKESVGGRETAV